jgi:hypothetical protein
MYTFVLRVIHTPVASASSAMIGNAMVRGSRGNGHLSAGAPRSERSVPDRKPLGALLAVLLRRGAMLVSKTYLLTYFCWLQLKKFFLLLCSCAPSSRVIPTQHSLPFLALGHTARAPLRGRSQDRGLPCSFWRRPACRLVATRRAASSNLPTPRAHATVRGRCSSTGAASETAPSAATTAATRPT